MRCMMMIVFILKQKSFVLKGKYYRSFLDLLSFCLVTVLSVLRFTASDSVVLLSKVFYKYELSS